MKLCETESSQQLRAKDVELGIAYRIKNVPGSLFMTLEFSKSGNYEYVEAIDLFTGRTWTLNSEPVIAYPDACIKLGEPKEYE